MPELWEIKNEFPDLKDAKLIAFDVETRDPNLLEKGPGVFRRDGHVIGIAVSADFGDYRFKNYYPINHVNGENMDRTLVVRYLNDQLRSSTPKVAANILYDLLWCWYEGITVNGPLYDVQNAEPLIDEEKEGGYSLDNLAKFYLNLHKDEALLEEGAQKFGLKNIKNEMWKLPQEYVGGYATTDTDLTLDIFKKQREILKTQGLESIFELETRFTRVLFDMITRGVRVDINKAERLNGFYLKKEFEYVQRLKDLLGFSINIWASADLERALKKLGFPVFYTDKGNPSVTKEYLELNKEKHEFFRVLLDFRNINKLRRDFIEGLVLEWNINGRIYPQIHQLRRDGSGTRSGRLSYSNPNLQQVPARDAEIAPLIRSLFIPEDGEIWVKCDYSQQEPRLAVHFAALMNLKGAEKIKQEYINNPEHDFYQSLVEMAGISRRMSKNMTLGIMYAMGRAKLASSLNVGIEQGIEIRKLFDESVPFLSDLQKTCTRVAQNRGWIKTILGRKAHFNRWEPNVYEPGKYYDAYSREKAEQVYVQGMAVPIRRAFTYKALNRLIQGSAADMTKKAMLDLYDAGYGKHLRIQVHDELDFSLPDKNGVRDIVNLMENATPLVVPVKVDFEMGKNWGMMD